MHAAAQWTSLMWLFCGAKVVLTTGPLDPVKVWDLVSSERPNMLTLVGDAVAKPLLDACDAAEPGRWAASSLFAIPHGGAPLLAGGTDRLLGRSPDERRAANQCGRPCSTRGGRC